MAPDGKANASDGKTVMNSILAPFNPSSDQIQQKAMDLLVNPLMADPSTLAPGPVLFDLGCGDARLLIACAKKYPSLRCVGVEIDQIFANRAIENIKGLPEIYDRIYIHQQDALTLPMTTPQASRSRISDLTLIDDADALYLFVLPKGIEKLMPILTAVLERRKNEGLNFRILSYMFKLKEWEPTLIDRTTKGSCPIYLYDFFFASSALDSK